MRPSKRRARTLTADESRRASTTCRARCVDEAPEAKNVEDSSVVGRADPRGQARAYAAQAGAAQGPLAADESRRASTTCGARRVDETPEAKDAEDSRVEGRADPTGGEEEPHQRARASAANAIVAGVAQGPLAGDG